MSELNKTVFTYEQAINDSISYFGGEELPARVFVDKYSLRDNDGNILENTPDMMHRRLAREFARIEKDKFKEPMTEEQIYELFKGFKYIVCQGSPMYGIGNNYTYQSLGNCFTLGEHPHDSYGGIMYADQMLVQLAKRRCGVGVCLDNIRPKGLPTKNAARTTDGIAVFMERFSNSTREVAMSGRRGALLLGISVHHPEVETFINIKKNLTKVTGANVSVIVTDDFMDAVVNNKEYEQRWPLDNSVEPVISRKVSAQKIWDQIIDGVWSSAEPGILYRDNARKYGTSHQYHLKDKRFADIITNPSLKADTLVLTNEGHKQIKDLVGSNLQVRTINYEWSNFICTYTGHKQLWKIKTKDHEVYCTAEHKWPVISHNGIELKHTKDIISGLHCLIPDHQDWGIAKPIHIEKIEQTDLYDDVYDITTLEESHSFALSNGIISSNCGEIWMGADSCRLMLINLYNYVENPFKENATFNYELFAEHTKIAQRLMDDMVDLEIEKIEKILEKIDHDPEPEYVKTVEKDMWKNYLDVAKLGRRTGLGITGLGDALAAIGIKYGSEDSIKETEKIYQSLAINSMRSSCEMAKELGHFQIYDENIENDSEFLNNLFGLDKELKELHHKYGRRNISLTTTAPGGSVSILTETTSGIEPAFLLEYKRRRKVNKDDPNAKIVFTDATGDSWEEYVVRHKHLQTWMSVTGNQNIKESPYYGATSNEIDWKASVRLQGVAQKFITHSISKTCNVPKNTTKEQVAEIYLEAYKAKCKGFTLYRDGCRDGVLISNEPKLSSASKQKSDEDRPKELKCEVHHVIISGKPYFILVGLDGSSGEPYEVFAGRNGFLDKSVKSGRIIKMKKRQYKAVFEDDTELSPITATSSEHEETITRLTSALLRSKASIQMIVQQLERVGGDMHSFAKGLSRCLKKWIKDGSEEKGEVCPECQSTSLIRQEGCITCKCGFSKCS